MELNGMEPNGRARRIPRGTHWAIGGLLVVVAGMLLPIPTVGRLTATVGDLAHAPIFGGLALVLLSLLDRYRPIRTASWAPVIARMLWVFLVVFSFGAFMELSQSLMGRHAAIHDMIANAIGIVVALLWYASRRLTRTRPEKVWTPRAMLLSAGLLLAVAWWSPVSVLRDIIRVRLEFPVLASFESPAHLSRFSYLNCEARLTRQDATEGNYAMELAFQPSDYAAAVLVGLSPDWSEVESLDFDVTLDREKSGEGAPSQVPVILNVRVLDAHHTGEPWDAYRNAYELTAGRTKSIHVTREALLDGPRSRRTDLSKIRFVDLSVSNIRESTRLRIDAMRLNLRRGPR